MFKDIYFNGKVIGKVSGNTYITHRKPQHFMKIYGGFGISDSVLKELIELHVVKVNIIYHGSFGIKEYEVLLNDYLESTLTWTDYNNDTQRFVRITDKRKIPEKIDKKGQTSLDFEWKQRSLLKTNKEKGEGIFPMEKKEDSI